MRRILPAFVPALLSALAVAASAGAATARPATEPDLAAMSPAELTVFLRAFPKGGELHNHLGGGTPAEDLLAWAVEDGACVDTVELALRPTCGGPNLRPAADYAADETLRSALIDSLTTRHPGFRDRSGHDQFFSAFGRRGGRASRNGDALAETLDGLARQNTWYAELMVTFQAGPARTMGAKAGWTGNVAATRAALTAAGVEGLAAAVSADTDAMLARSREVLRCGTPAARPGCDVTVRFLAQSIRQGPPEQTMAQLQLGVATVKRDPRWVGLQLVAPEDSADAMRFYGEHMRMVDVLTDHGRAVPVALHAGELTLKIARPLDLTHHVADAVRIAGARRIGHGVDLPMETDAQALAAEMAAKGVLVEVNLLSNQTILEIPPAEHPYAWFRKMGVPVALSTDDAGITRSELSGDYAAAVRNGATYADLKTAARNGIAFSFLTGEGLWRDPNVYRRPAAACAGQIGEPMPRGACAELVARSDKAREQWRHERLLRAFETRFEAAR